MKSTRKPGAISNHTTLFTNPDNTYSPLSVTTGLQQTNSTLAPLKGAAISIFNATHANRCPAMCGDFNPDPKTGYAKFLHLGTTRIWNADDTVNETYWLRLVDYISTNQRNDKSGRDLTLMSIDDVITTDDVKKIDKDIMQKAKENDTPILIKTRDKFVIYGDPKRDGDWHLTEIENKDLELDELPFEEGRMKEDDPLFSSYLHDVLKKGHTQNFNIKKSTLKNYLKFYSKIDLPEHDTGRNADSLFSSKTVQQIAAIAAWDQVYEIAAHSLIDGEPALTLDQVRHFFEDATEEFVKTKQESLSVKPVICMASPKI